MSRGVTNRITVNIPFSEGHRSELIVYLFSPNFILIYVRGVVLPHRKRLTSSKIFHIINFWSLFFESSFTYTCVDTLFGLSSTDNYSDIVPSLRFL